MSTPLVNLPELMLINVAMVDAYGGGIGVRDQAFIESALHRPLATYDGKEPYPTPFSRAATLWWGLIKNRGFVDANNRTATAAALRWLEREGYELNATDAELIEVATRIANDGATVESLARWVSDACHGRTGKWFGPGPNDYDPYDGVGEEEFEREVERVLMERGRDIEGR